MTTLAEAGSAVGAAAEPRTRRQRRSRLEKRRIVEETLAPGASVARVARAHGVNANQVFKWRRLYEQGLLETGTAALLPVRVSDSEVNAALAARAATTRRTSQCSASGIIEIELARGRVRIEGDANAESLRLVLEYLRG